MSRHVALDNSIHSIIEAGQELRWLAEEHPAIAERLQELALRLLATSDTLDDVYRAVLKESV